MTDERKIIEIVVDVENLPVSQVRLIANRLLDALSTDRQTTVIFTEDQLKVVREDAKFWEIKAITDKVFRTLEVNPLRVIVQEPSPESALAYRIQQGSSARGPVTLEDPLEFVHEAEVIKNDLPPLTGIKEIGGLEPYLEAYKNKAKGSGTPFYNSLRIAMRNRAESGVVDVFDASGSMRSADLQKAADQLSKPLNDVEGSIRSMYSGDSK